MIKLAKWNKFYPLLRLVVALAMAWLVLQFPLYYIEGVLFDARQRLSPNPKITRQIELIAIDAKTLSALRGEPSVRDQHNVLNQLLTEAPTAIVQLDDPSRWEGPEQDRSDFVSQAKKIKALIFATDQPTPVSSYSKFKLAEPYQDLEVASAPITRDHVSFAGDKVTRRHLVSFEGESTLQTKLAQKLNPKIQDLQSINGLFEQDNTQQTYIHFSSPRSFRQWSFIDIRDGRFPKGTFDNKIVLIGNDSGQDSDNYITTPLSRDPLGLSKLEAHAQIINTLAQNIGYSKASDLVDLIFTCLVSTLTVFIVWRLRPLKGLAMLVAQAFIICLSSYILLVVAEFWLNLTHPLLAIFVSYYFFIPYRLIKENKRSWEFEQKNRLLTQVEELKTNFLSMMSHDLKTPIARIHGMAETALSEDKSLGENQKKALHTIIQSSEQLNQFIESILDLSRIEAKAVKLHKTSKDINTLVQDVTDRYEFLAQSKNIQIVKELEPLFSVKIDGELIRQVLSNLIENAIKYSPENSTIKVRTKEGHGKIKVSVVDEGPGIPPEELDNVFLKFYRSKQVKTSAIKGTGLGLYLAKYFVELHGGSLKAESQIQKGSRFTVEIPF